MPSLKFPLSLEISSLCSESADGSIDIRNIDTNTNTIKDTNTNSNKVQIQIEMIGITKFEISSLHLE